MSPATLLAHPAAVRLDYIRPVRGVITLVVHTIAESTICPRCRRASSRVHSHYVRTVADLSWHGVSVKLQRRGLTAAKLPQVIPSPSRLRSIPPSRAAARRR
ncbi:MAG: transposase family protein [Acidobacteria bacterium]|nr:transposase family protein [Acidobacteriota bacterium]MCA1640922.1 transposase family protein [Acidobacteriota bacterium]